MTEVRPPSTEDSAFHAQSMPLVRARPAHQALFPYFLVVLATLLVVGAGGYWWLNSAARAEMESGKLDVLRAQMQKQHDIDVLKLTHDLERKQQDAKMAEQRDAHAQLAERADTALKRVADLETAQKDWRELLASQGRELAARDELLTKYQAIERELPVIQFATASVRERVTSIGDRSGKLASGTEITAGPSPEAKQQIDTDIAQVEVALAAQASANQALRALVSEATADGVPPANVGLVEAIELRVQRAEQARLQALAEAEDRGRKDAEERLRALAEQKVKENTDIEVDAATRAFDQQQDTIKRLHDQRHLAQQAQDEEQVRILTAQLDKEIAELRGKASLAEAEIKVTEAAAAAKQSQKQLEAERIAQETEKNRLREKAKSSDVAQALAPFFGKGYWQPGNTKANSIDPLPVSLSAIQGTGALTATPAGLHQLYMIGANPKIGRSGAWPEKERGVGHGDDAWLRNKPSAVATARKAQELLIELGPTLVELGLLAP